MAGKDASAATAAVSTEKKTRAPQKAAPTSVLLYVDENDEPQIYSGSRNGHALITAFQEAQAKGIKLFVRTMAPATRAPNGSNAA